LKIEDRQRIEDGGWKIEDEGLKVEDGGSKIERLLTLRLQKIENGTTMK
jgi:hypothetical protein